MRHGRYWFCLGVLWVIASFRLRLTRTTSGGPLAIPSRECAAPSDHRGHSSSRCHRSFRRGSTQALTISCFPPPSLTMDERMRLKQLERENFELKRANEILRKASAFFARRSSTTAIVGRSTCRSLHRAAGRGQRRALRRQSWRFVRQRSGRVGHRPVQDRSDLAPRSLAHPGHPGASRHFPARPSWEPCVGGCGPAGGMERMRHLAHLKP